MTLFRNYSQHMLSALWRRKSSALAVVMILAVLMLFVHYQSVQQQQDGREHGKSGGAAAFAPRAMDSRTTGNASDAIGSLEVVDRLEPERSPPPGIDLNRFRQQHKHNNGRMGSVFPLNPDGQQNGGSRFNPFQKSNDNNNNNNEDNDRAAAPSSMLSDDHRAANNVPFRSDTSGYFSGGQQQQQQQQEMQMHPMAPPRTPYVPQRRLFHLDLKGAPPKVSYLKKLFPLLRNLGATGLLIEYEDMFPYEGDLASTVAKNHYTKGDVRAILQMAKEAGLEVIPLVQTFGHAEFILKHRPFSHMREVVNQPQSFCPSNNDSLSIVEDMIDQVMAAHPDIRWLHIGCDEVFQLGACPKCMMRSMAQGRDAIFLSHVARVASYVRERHNVSPIIWDDMLHHLTAEVLKSYDLGNLVEIMVWTYVQDIYRFIPHDVWAMYGEVFPYVWSASAFKGAFGETLSVPPVKMHLENNVAWLDVMSRERGRFRGEFRGIALTGWQRYDHFATLCELLPAGLPSAAVNMLTLSHGYYNETWMQKLYNSLQCMKSPKTNTFVNLDVDPYLWDKMAWCFFPGLSFFKMTERLDGVRKSVSQFLADETVKKAWLTEYNVRHNFSSIPRIDASLSNFPFQYPDVETLIRNARDTLREVFDEYTVAEWIEQNVYPMLRKLDLFRQTAESLKRASVWPARPLEPLPELHKYGIGIPTDNPSQRSGR